MNMQPPTHTDLQTPQPSHNPTTKCQPVLTLTLHSLALAVLLEGLVAGALGCLPQSGPPQLPHAGRLGAEAGTTPLPHCESRCSRYRRSHTHTVTQVGSPSLQPLFSQCGCVALSGLAAANIEGGPRTADERKLARSTRASNAVRDTARCTAHTLLATSGSSHTNGHWHRLGAPLIVCSAPLWLPWDRTTFCSSCRCVPLPMVPRHQQEVGNNPPHTLHVCTLHC